MEIGTHRKEDTVVVDLSGDWHLEESLPSFEEVVAGHRHHDGAVGEVGFDAVKLGSWDSGLLVFLIQGVEYCREHGLEFRQQDLPEEIRHLIELSRAVPERDVQREEAPSSIAGRIGKTTLQIYDSALESIRFVGQVSVSFARLLTGRGQFRWHDFWLTIQSNGSGALAIVTLISFLSGLIISFLGAVVLERFGAGYYVSYLVSYGVLRELGALMTGIIMAGRTGAAYAAELGSMKITEELDAFRTLGIAPIDYLVLPRVLAITIMLPLLTVYADFIGIAGGMSVALGMLDLSIVQFTSGLLEPVVLTDALLGIFKGLVFGIVIGLAGCMRGMQTGSDAGAVGKAATRAVVTAITLIIFANAVIDWAAALLNV